jgi:hypothetical protein
MTAPVLGFKLEFIAGEPTVYAGFEGLRRDHPSAGGRQTKRHGPQNVRVNVFGSEEGAPSEALKTRGGGPPRPSRARAAG